MWQRRTPLWICNHVRSAMMREHRAGWHCIFARGLCVVRSTNPGIAKASNCGAGNRYRPCAFLFPTSQAQERGPAAQRNLWPTTRRFYKITVTGTILSGSGNSEPGPMRPICPNLGGDGIPHAVRSYIASWSISARDREENYSRRPAYPAHQGAASADCHIPPLCSAVCCARISPTPSAGITDAAIVR